jgi:uncharacterized protein YndB with AHSA1/START domain
MVARQAIDDEAEREIVLTRVFDAPVELVFAAYTDPKHVASWWGPRGYTIKVHEMDVRPGGIWRFLMVGPDGTEWPNRIRYLEVDRPRRLVWEHGSDDEPKQFVATVTFTARGDKTELRMRTLLPTKEALARVKGFGAEELGYQTLDKFGEHLRTRQG